MKPALHVENLAVTYDDHQALKPLNFDVFPHELVGIIGPNGAGKTSLIKALCGRLKYNGHVEINKTQITPHTNRQKLLGLVPQDIGLYGHMSARENLHCFSKIMGLTGKDSHDAIEQALSAVDMTPKADTLVKALSGGMKRRINVAAAIMHNPKLIIFDEPTAGVDIPARNTVHRLARTLAEKGMAILLVTHELEQAEALCDKLLILSKGKKLAYDAPAKILEQCFDNQREIVVRFAASPPQAMMDAMKPFGFQQGELPTIWTAMTRSQDEALIAKIIKALGGDNDFIREMTMRRPGLTTLMHRIEKTGALS